jgi:hypothetical protein
MAHGVESRCGLTDVGRTHLLRACGEVAAGHGGRGSGESLQGAGEPAGEEGDEDEGADDGEQERQDTSAGRVLQRCGHRPQGRGHPEAHRGIRHGPPDREPLLAA